MFRKWNLLDYYWLVQGGLRKRGQTLGWFTQFYSPKQETLVEERDADDLWFRSAEVELSVEHLGGDVWWEVRLIRPELREGFGQRQI